MDKKQKEALQDYPGAAFNKADDDKDTKKLRKQTTKILNDNPRSDDGPCPFTEK